MEVNTLICKFLFPCSVSFFSFFLGRGVFCVSFT